MSIVDGFWFGIGKMLGEAALVLGVMLAVVVLVGLTLGVLALDARRRRRRARGG